MAFLAAAIVLSAEREGIAAVESAWSYVTDEVEGAFGHRASCVSTDGSVAIVAKSNVEARDEVVVLRLSPTGVSSRRVLTDLPTEAGSVRRAHNCLWLANDGLVVIVKTRDVPLAALWLAADLSLDGWLALERKNDDMHPWAMAEIAPGRFVVVGMSEVDAFALWYDRRSSEGVRLPWFEERDRFLMDVGAEEEGGFSVCGPEGGIRGESYRSVDLVLATFDDMGSLRAQTRLPGIVCRLLPSASGRVRVLHDDGVTKPRTLSVTTLDENLRPIADEPLVTPFFSGFIIPSFEMDGHLFVVNTAYAWETLEIRGPSLRDSVDLEVHPGGVLALLPGPPARVYLVSTTRHERPGERDHSGVRVDAFDVQLTRP